MNYMKNLDTLRAYGLFDAKVPRYTSYPPANRFASTIGAEHAPGWISTIPDGADISVYVHIPFCRRLCWFCACRTQGTKTLGPVEAYIATLIDEITAVADQLPGDIRMKRLHLGGGTPTLLTGEQMERLLTALHTSFRPSEDLEFSVEIDPTEASDEVIERLCAWKMTRASIGVQDFNPDVQNAIGREQSLEQTEIVIRKLRKLGVRSLNIDLLYGLPHQTVESLQETLDDVILLRPDRVALYGYAHVPHMSKRQVMIDGAALPDTHMRYRLAEMAKVNLTGFGYEAIGIDHFALPSDSLTKAAHSGALRRNFQGYTDDPCAYLIGLGASAISSFPQGYWQNAVATAAYTQRVRQDGTAAQKGIELEDEDKIIAQMISDLMCYGEVAFHDGSPNTYLMQHLSKDLAANFSEAVDLTPDSLSIREGYTCLARVLCAWLEGAIFKGKQNHSAAI